MIGLIAVMATVFGVSALTAQTKYGGAEDKPGTVDTREEGEKMRIGDTYETAPKKPKAPEKPKIIPAFERNIQLYGNPWHGDTTTWKNATGSGFVEAVKSLKQLQAKVEIGISYKDYTAALGDVKFAVDNFLANPDAKDKPALSSAISTSLKCYLDAKTLWRLKIEGTELNRAFRGLGIKSDSDDFLRTGGRHVDDIWKVLVNDHPELAVLATAGESRLDYHGDRYYILKIDDLIRILWDKASASIPPKSLAEQ